MSDATIIRGTMVRGSKNGRATLTEDDVKAIKFGIEVLGVRNKELADHFEVKASTISNIRRGKTWDYLKWEDVE